MSCNCGALKVNLCETGVFSLAKLAMIDPRGGKKMEAEGTGYKSGKKLKNALLGDSIVYGISGVVYDKWISPGMYNSQWAGQMVLSDKAMKVVYQVLIQQLYDMSMKRKFNVKNLLEDAIASAVAIYGPEMLDGMDKGMISTGQAKR